MNITEFIKNLVLTFDDLKNMGNVGFVNGASECIIKHLKDMDISKRPIHCTDFKRETIYVKEDDGWTKDDEDNTIMKKALKTYEFYNVNLLNGWRLATPDADVNNTDNTRLRDKIYLQTLQGEDKTREKIIKKISKEVTVDRLPGSLE
jgi:hypothetical protein